MSEQPNAGGRGVTPFTVRWQRYSTRDELVRLCESVVICACFVVAVGIFMQRWFPAFFVIASALSAYAFSHIRIERKERGHS
jgi:hypothetical protein